ncbi:DNA recombination protein RmuC [Sphingobacterium sp. lm-10]|uniref:DNA recombination protein RmuC n=1 Tax=Sphingobacterium sp. lm-10 TaxID=2944904 RepID=UPI002022814E|nr:DNA recombination protein RmuC [Sphingobacterium sp. lm-10]MCL7986545.1 DNA recombination protein RmuC [Sphingobacterium sp. lm-10]
MIHTLLIVLIALAVINLLVLLLKKSGNSSSAQWRNMEQGLQRLDHQLERMDKSTRDDLHRHRNENSALAQANREELSINFRSLEKSAQEQAQALHTFLGQRFESLTKQQYEINKTANDHLKDIKISIENHLKALREDNNRQLEQMRHTVDEKLQSTLEKRLGESFKLVSERLELVHRGLGEMQTLANGVGDLKKVLSNVKTRGILGEYQLANILEQLLTNEQYAQNVATKKGSQAHVEFAIKLPGKDSDETVWMPVDSKFPIENYQALMDAYEVGEKNQIELQQKILMRNVEAFAKDISDKYIDPPHTTDFAIMFLPIESLYAEILRHPGLFETLQRKYRVTITGPTTLSALLNSLQMGFRTLAVQKRSSEVWKILEAVKTEFKKFSDQLDKVDKQLSSASKSLHDLRLTRTNMMSRKLRDIGTLDVQESNDLLDLPISEDE